MICVKVKEQLICLMERNILDNGKQIKNMVKVRLLKQMKKIVGKVSGKMIRELNGLIDI